MKNYLYILPLVMLLFSCTTSKVPVNETPDHLSSNPAGEGPKLEIEMTRGVAFNHPLMAIWVENESGEFLQTLYVAESIGKGIFQHGDASKGFWMPGEILRPAALPRWSHQRGIRTEDGLYLPTPQNPVADAYTGPTPGKSFILHTRLNEAVTGGFRVLFEINQTWDWNEYWTNNKYPDDDEYKTSCQPALVYAVEIDMNNDQTSYTMKPIGHSHYSGKTGELFTDLSTITTALEIVEELIISIPNSKF